MKKLWVVAGFLAAVIALAIGCAARQTVSGTVGGSVPVVSALTFAAPTTFTPYVAGQPWSMNLATSAAGGEPPYSVKCSTVSPSWLALSSTGVLSGTVPAGTTGSVALSASFILQDSDRSTDAAGTGTCPAGSVTGQLVVTGEIRSAD